MKESLRNKLKKHPILTWYAGTMVVFPSLAACSSYAYTKLEENGNHPLLTLVAAGAFFISVTATYGAFMAPFLDSPKESHNESDLRRKNIENKLDKED